MSARLIFGVGLAITLGNPAHSDTLTRSTDISALNADISLADGAETNVAIPISLPNPSLGTVIGTSLSFTGTLSATSYVHSNYSYYANPSAISSTGISIDLSPFNLPTIDQFHTIVAPCPSGPCGPGMSITNTLTKDVSNYVSTPAGSNPSGGTLNVNILSNQTTLDGGVSIIGTQHISETVTVTRTYTDVPIKNNAYAVAGLGLSSYGLIDSAIAVGAAIPTGGLSLALVLGEAVSFAGAGLSLAAIIDPFDPNYTVITQPNPINVPIVFSSQDISPTLAALTNLSLTDAAAALSYMQAALTTLNRLSSAVFVGDLPTADIQNTALGEYVYTAGTKLKLYAADLNSIADELQREGNNPSVSKAQLVDLLSQIQTYGFDALPETEKQFFLSNGISEDTINLALAQLNGFDANAFATDLISVTRELAEYNLELGDGYMGTVSEPSALILLLSVIMIWFAIFKIRKSSARHGTFEETA